MKRLVLILFVGLLTLAAEGQMVNPVHFSSQLKTLKGGEAEIIFSATIDDGWHVYSTDMGSDGPISATFNVVKMEGVETVGKLQPRGQVTKQYDKMFGMELRFFEKKGQFVQRVRFTQSKYVIDCYLEYGACNDEMCLPPTEVAFKTEGVCKELKEDKKEIKEEKVVPVAPEPEKPADTVAMIEMPAGTDSTVTTEVQEPVAMPMVEEKVTDHSLLYILLMGFVGGLLAVVMPCIWPVIPMTVSFFLKRAKTNRSRGIRDALVYGLSIVIIYLTLGLLVTAIFGSDTLNALSTNAVFNVLLFLLLVIFALSFFGWFEIRLPDSWASRVDEKADSLSTGSSSWTTYLSIFLMALTLVLVSFSCTAPIVGLLLVETATSGQWLAPAVGMLGFAVALALPFTLFALFPSWLQQAPKSGSWMNTLKVTLGFIELAFALKFLSVADLAYGWHILDREVFLSLWIVIFALLGAYLCGWLKLGEEENRGKWQVPCVMGGLVSLAFAVYMMPGLWGAPCKAVSAFAPPMFTQDFNLNNKVVEARYNDFDEALAAARRENKPILVDFTGFGCVNCRKMEAAVWTDPQVADMLMNDYILVSLYVDDKTPLPEPVEVSDGQGGTRTLRTIGAKWSDLQSRRYGTNAQPYYVIIDSEGNQLAPGRGYNEDVAAFVKFLKQSNY
ncbi:MAG: thioredoxin family protein [Prevotella sp.]|nr:thioredoxin family protein [Prevotella sp.]